MHSKLLILYLCALLSGKQFPGNPTSPAGRNDGTAKPKHAFVGFLQDYLALKYSGRDFNEYLYVSIKKQRLYHIQQKEVMGEYVISPPDKGAGAEQHSEKTPTGLHSINNKIGDGVPPGGIFINRSYSGKTTRIYTDRTSTGNDEVTTRILWLAGEEQGVNKGGDKDSYARHIYIHGTPEEGLLGAPASHGCIRMKNNEVIELYQHASKGMYVIILNN